MKMNYQLSTDVVIRALEGEKPSLLLQCCCGPCSSYVLEYLTARFRVTALFYNPNIQPPEEYEKRRFWLQNVIERYGGQVELLPCQYDGGSFEEIASGYEDAPEGGERCTRCFRLRLEQTAKRAREGGFDFFCTTLTVSPHKDAHRLNAIGFEMEEKYAVRWLPSDFKKRDGYKRSLELSAQYGLYRQDYCGCLYSKREGGKENESQHHA